MVTKTEKIEGLRRKRLTQRFAKLGLNYGAEIGVQKGKFSKEMFRHNPNLKLIAVDNWGVEEQRASEIGQEHQDELYRLCVEALTPLNAEIIKKPSMEAVLDFPYDSLDFVYIDAGHNFDWVMCDIIEWGKRVKTGGWISGHDYANFRRCGVIEAVDIYCQMHRVKTLYLTDEVLDKHASWFFEKTWTTEK